MVFFKPAIVILILPYSTSTSSPGVKNRLNKAVNTISTITALSPFIIYLKGTADSLIITARYMVAIIYAVGVLLKNNVIINEFGYSREETASVDVYFNHDDEGHKVFSWVMNNVNIYNQYKNAIKRFNRLVKSLKFI